jgi:flotillin
MTSSALLAAGLTPEALVGIITVFAAIVVLNFVILLVKRLKRCPSNRVLVISGRGSDGRNTVTCVRGGAKFVVPLFQDYAWLSLEPIRIEIPLQGAFSRGDSGENSPSAFTVAIGTTPELMQTAAAHLVGLTQAQITELARDMILAQLRRVIASIQIDDINRDYDKLVNAIRDALEPELSKLGLLLVNVNLFGSDLRLQISEPNEDRSRTRCRCNDVQGSAGITH